MTQHITGKRLIVMAVALISVLVGGHFLLRQPSKPEPVSYTHLTLPTKA
jgi:hypothetical protein